MDRGKKGRDRGMEGVSDGRRPPLQGGEHAAEEGEAVIDDRGGFDVHAVSEEFAFAGGDEEEAVGEGPEGDGGGFQVAGGGLDGAVGDALGESLGEEGEGGVGVGKGAGAGTGAGFLFGVEAEVDGIFAGESVVGAANGFEAVETGAAGREGGGEEGAEDIGAAIADGVVEVVAGGEVDVDEGAADAGELGDFAEVCLGPAFFGEELFGGVDDGLAALLFFLLAADLDEVGDEGFVEIAKGLAGIIKCFGRGHRFGRESLVWAGGSPAV